jgi:1-aminocyclopropane-1-carboxylate deaminase
LNTYHSTPIYELQHNLLKKANVKLLVKREDLNHSLISGNKWWKLKYNLEQATQLNKTTILTFGGAYSNHIYATAAAAREANLKSIGIIRGEESLPLNQTLTFAINQGMEIHYISRSDYREKTTSNFINNLINTFGDFYLIPEGGTNEFAVKGCAEFARQELHNIDFDYLFLPVGTGGTMAGIICGLGGTRHITGISVLKNGDFLKNEIETLVKNFSNEFYRNWSLLTAYHHGGYAKVTDELLNFIATMKIEHNLPLDPVYTGKLLWAVLKEIESGMVRPGSTVLALHTGGLQGASAL